MRKYAQCVCQRGDEVITAFIEDYGAKVGMMVMIHEKPGDLWRVNAVLSRLMDINEVFKGPPYDPPNS